MRNRALFIIVVFLFVFSGTGGAIDSLTSGNPAGFSTFRSGSLGSDLFRSPNPIDTSGNLVITGNVRGGRHFRGVVPYGAITDFGAATGSSSLDSFLRRSAGSEDFGRFAGTYRPFFSPSSTVTTLSPGQVPIMRPPTMLIGGGVPASETTGALPYPSDQRFLPYSGLDVSGGQLRNLRFTSLQTDGGVLWVPSITPGAGVSRPLSMTLQEVERAILAEVGLPIYQNISAMPGRRETATEQETRAQQFPQVIEELAKQHTEIKQRLVGEGDESSQFQMGQVLERDALRPSELRRSSMMEGKQPDADRDTRLDIYEHMDEQIAELQKSYEQLMAAEIARRASVGTQDVDGEKLAGEDSRDSASGKEGVAERGPSSFGTISSGLMESASLTSERLARSKVRGSESMGASDKADLSARAKAILGPYNNAMAFWDAKFNQHMATAEKYLEDGKFYRSADAYTLALVYEPGEGLAYIGKSHALFAAGEYISSALFLSRAVTAASEGHDKKGDEVQQLLAASSKLLALIDKDKLESRLVDVEQWQQRSGSVELQFLLGYIYYQMGRLEAARGVIDDAYNKMPESSAVVALREIIDSKRSPQDKNQ